MRCPKCQFDHELQTTECLKCGINFARYRAAVDAAAATKVATVVEPMAPDPAVPDSEALTARSEALRELKCRALAIPLALFLARLLAGTGFRMLEGMLAMLLHESGHAIAAWLTGRWAIPTLWVTMWGQTRSWLVVLAVTGAIVSGGFLAWKARRWGWVCAAGAMLVVQLIFLRLPAESTIVFCGDGGAMVLGTILMAAFYAPRESALSKSWGLRWGLLVIGGLGFMHVFLLWTGPWGDLPFGEIEGVNLSDPSLLTEYYGWSIAKLVDRYVYLGKVCLVAMVVVYVWGLVSTYLETRLSASSEKQRILASE
jgi:hypothetical protein